MSTVTVGQSEPIPGFAAGLSSVMLRIYLQESFITSSGVTLQAGRVDKKDWYLSITCTVEGETVTIPSFQIDSTTDGLDTRYARYTAWFYSGNRKLGVYQGFEDFKVGHSALMVTWSEIRLYNVNVATPNDQSGFFTKDQALALFQLASSGSITSLTGDVTTSGQGAATATIGAGRVTNAMLAGSISDSKLNQIATAGKVADSALSSNIPLLNAANAFTGRMTASATPAFDLAAGALATDFLSSHSGAVIPANKTFSGIRLGQSDGSSNSFTIGAGSIVSNIGSFARALSGTHPTANLYATVVQAENAGPGTVKSLHVLSSGVAGSTGVLAAASFDVAPVSGQGATFAIQVASSGIDNLARGITYTTNGGNFDYGIDFVGYSTIPGYNSAVIRLPNNASIVARNAANNANLAVYKVNAADEIEFLQSKIVINQADPYVQVGSTAAGWLFQKVDADSRWRMFKQGLGEAFSLSSAGIPKFWMGNTTGAGTPSLGSNFPGTITTAPYTWIPIDAADGTRCYLPAWK